MPAWGDNSATGPAALAGLQKTSLIDFPGKVSCVAFTTGCNFHCPYCHNPELAKGHWPAPLTLPALEAFLCQRRHLLDGVVISGGEPSLSPVLADLCQIIHRSGLLVKLDTNGSRPKVLSRLIRGGLVDYIAMDIKTAPDRYGLLTAEPHIEAALHQSIGIIMDSCPAYEFRTTCVQPFVDAQQMLKIGQAIRGASRYVLQTFSRGKLLDPEFDMDAERAMTASQMSAMQTIAAQWVACCQIR